MEEIMYSPYSDLEKMFETPKAFLFKVSINGKEYFCRVNTLSHITKPVSGSLEIYPNVMAFQRGEAPSHRMIVDNKEVIGIEVIDTKFDGKPAPINVILAYCNAIDEIKEDADIGVIRRNIPPLIENLMGAVEEYILEYPSYNPPYTVDVINELIGECKNAKDNSTGEERKKIITNVKHVVSFQISSLVRLSS